MEEEKLPFGTKNGLPTTLPSCMAVPMIVSIAMPKQCPSVSSERPLKHGAMKNLPL